MITIDMQNFVDQVLSIAKFLVFDLFLPIIKDRLEATPPELIVLLTILGLVSAVLKIVHRLARLA